MPEIEIIEDFDRAMQKLRFFKAANNYAELVASDSTNFKIAALSEHGFCSLWEIESGSWILGLGEFHPAFIPSLLEHAPSNQIRASLPRTWTDVQLEKGSEWNFFLIQSATAPSQPMKHRVVELSDDDEINVFMDTHSTDSSTRPGDSEILFWHGIRSEEGILLSIGAAVRWKSGANMLVSIATAPSERGKSMAQEVTASLVKRLFDLGAPFVGLGVYAHNTTAIKAYERVGFQLKEEFVSGPLLRS